MNIYLNEVISGFNKFLQWSLDHFILTKFDVINAKNSEEEEEINKYMEK